MKLLNEKSIGVLYDFPIEYNAVLSSLKNDLPVKILRTTDVVLHPHRAEFDYSLVYNDFSAPTGFSYEQHFWTFAHTYTKTLESLHPSKAQSRIINGSHAIEVLSSRARQLSIFSSLGFSFPKTYVVNNLDRLFNLLPSLTFPLLIKGDKSYAPNNVNLFNNLSSLLKFMISHGSQYRDQVVIVQEYRSPKHGQIFRAETINGRFIMAQKIQTNREPLQQYNIEYEAQSYRPSTEVVRAVEQVARVARLDVGAIEFFIDRQTNDVQFYSIRPYTNSVRNEALQHLNHQFVDYVERRLMKVKEIALSL